MRVRLPNDFDPRPYQRRAFAYFDGGGTRACTVWPRRAGKDVGAMHHTAKAMHQEKGLYWHIYPTSEQGRKVIWRGMARGGRRIMEWVFPKEIRKFPREWNPQGEMVVELKCGSVWSLMGSDKMDIVGAGPTGVCLSEFALAKPTTWDLIRPMLRESAGRWAWIFSTPRGRNHLHKVYEQARLPGSGWFADLQTALTVGLTYASTRRPGVEIGPEEMMEEEKAEGMPQELIEQEYLCSFEAALVGSYWGVALAFLASHGGLQPFTTDGDNVFTAWDLGRSDDTAVWWWRFGNGGGVEVLDHYASHGEDVPHYFGVLEERAKTHGWTYRRHFLPHDARAKTLASKQSVLEQFLSKYGASAVAIAPHLDLDDGIKAARRLLLNDTTRIHPRCSMLADPAKDCDGVEALRAYHRQWDEERRAFRESPVHDWASHTADAFRYLAVSVEVARALVPKPVSPPVQLRTNLPTFDQFWSQHR